MHKKIIEAIGKQLDRIKQKHPRAYKETERLMKQILNSLRKIR